jgi:hypothetical protein
MGNIEAADYQAVDSEFANPERLESGTANRQPPNRQPPDGQSADGESTQGKRPDCRRTQPDRPARFPHELPPS